MKWVAFLAILLAVSAFQLSRTNSHHHSQPKAGTSVLSMFYCGFGDKFCGQSTDDDVHPGATNVILAFVNTQTDGSVIMD
jgi:hypothetical protein